MKQLWWFLISSKKCNYGCKITPCMRWYVLLQKYSFTKFNCFRNSLEYCYVSLKYTFRNQISFTVAQFMVYIHTIREINKSHTSVLEVAVDFESNSTDRFGPNHSAWSCASALLALSIKTRLLAFHTFHFPFSSY